MKIAQEHTKDYSKASLLPATLSDKKLLREAGQWLDRIYSEDDAKEDETIRTFRDQIQTSLNNLAGRRLTPSEQAELKKLINELAGDEIHKLVTSSSSLPNLPPQSIAIEILSRIRLESHASLHTGDINIVLHQIRQEVETQELTLDEISHLRVLMDNYLTLHYVDERYASVSVLDKMIPFSPSLHNNLAIVDKPLQENKEGEVLTRAKNALNSFDMHFLQSNEDAYRDYQKELIHTQDIFTLPSDEQKAGKAPPKRILIHGRAGIGKTTLCQQICYEWAYGRLWRNKFEWVIWLPLREFNQEIKGYGLQLGDMLNAIVFSRSGYAGDATPHTLHRLLQEHVKENVLFLLDGYDELKADSPYRAVIDDLLSNHNPAHVIVTSRPFHLIDRTFDRTLEVVGFTEEKVKSYIAAYYDSDSEKIQSLISWLEGKPILLNLAHMPILLGLICYLWDSPQEAQILQKQQSLTMTELYTMLVDKLWRRYEEKYAPIAIDSEERIKFNQRRNLIRNFLEKMAFEMLNRDEVLIDVSAFCQIGYTVFKEHLSLGKPNDFEAYLGVMLEPGFLYKQSPGFLNREVYYYLHKTFQEYFAACYLTEAIKDSKEKSYKETNTLPIQQFIHTYRFDPKFQITWWFVAGLLTKEGLNTSLQHLLDEFLINEPTDLSGIYNIVLGMRCFEESRIAFTQKTQLIETIAHLLIQPSNMFDEKVYQTRHYLINNLRLSPWMYETSNIRSVLIEQLNNGLENERSSSSSNFLDILIGLNDTHPTVINTLLRILEKYIQKPFVSKEIVKSVFTTLENFQLKAGKLLAGSYTPSQLIQIMVNSSINYDDIPSKYLQEVNKYEPIYPILEKSIFLNAPEQQLKLLTLFGSLELKHYASYLNQFLKLLNYLLQSKNMDVYSTAFELFYKCEVYAGGVAFFPIMYPHPLLFTKNGQLTLEYCGQALFKLLEHKDKEIKKQAAFILLNLEQINPTIISCLFPDNPNIEQLFQKLLYQPLSQHEQRNLFTSLLLLCTDKNKKSSLYLDDRITYINLLTLIVKKDPIFPSLLIELLGSEDADSRRAAINVILSFLYNIEKNRISYQLTDNLLTALEVVIHLGNHNSLQHYAGAIIFLQHKLKEKIPDFLNTLIDIIKHDPKNKNKIIALEALKAEAQLPIQVIELLIQKLNDNSSSIISKAREVLLFIGKTHAELLQHFILQLNHPDTVSKLKIKICELLHELIINRILNNVAIIIGTVFTLFNKEEDKEIKKIAAKILYQLKSMDASVLGFFNTEIYYLSPKELMEWADHVVHVLKYNSDKEKTALLFALNGDTYRSNEKITLPLNIISSLLSLSKHANKTVNLVAALTLLTQDAILEFLHSKYKINLNLFKTILIHLANNTDGSIEDLCRKILQNLLNKHTKFLRLLIYVFLKIDDDEHAHLKKLLEYVLNPLNIPPDIALIPSFQSNTLMFKYTTTQNLMEMFGLTKDIYYLQIIASRLFSKISPIYIDDNKIFYYEGPKHTCIIYRQEDLDQIKEILINPINVRTTELTRSNFLGNSYNPYLTKENGFTQEEIDFANSPLLNFSAGNSELFITLFDDLRVEVLNCPTNSVSTSSFQKPTPPSISHYPSTFFSSNNNSSSPSTTNNNISNPSTTNNNISNPSATNNNTPKLF